jgi:hypothetical protein
MTQIVLTGLDGGNLLAFLAALGTLRTLTAAWPHKLPKLDWLQFAGAWRPRVSLSGRVTNDGMLAALEARLQEMSGHTSFTFAKNLNVTREEFRAFEQEAVSRAVHERDLRATDFAAAFGCDGVSGENGQIEDTAFRTMSGAGHQNFLESMQLLAEETTRAHLNAALFLPWTYDDPRPSMRWDPIDDRRYALRWKDPSGDPIHTVRGANRLGIEALPLFSVVPVNGRLATTGFKGTGRLNTFLTWPIWSAPIGLDVARSLLALEGLQAPLPDRSKFMAVGIVEIYRSQRITVGKYRNFTPAQPV